MDILLNAVEARVLGSLIEKEITTPDYYPLSLNALVNACNQKSNRDPLMNLNEDAVRQALRGLDDLELASIRVDSRVPKHEHRVQEVFNFTRGETAIVCALLLRGPQTLGELRGHTERLFRFEDLSDVQSVLQRLMQREPPLVKILPRQPGTKESRYAHLLSGDVEIPESAPQAAAGKGPVDSERLAQLEEEVGHLRDEIAELKEQLQSFRRQFE